MWLLGSCGDSSAATGQTAGGSTSGADTTAGLGSTDAASTTAAAGTTADSATTGGSGSTGDAASTGDVGPIECDAGPPGTIRVATFNASMSGHEGPTGLVELLSGDGGKAPQVAEIIQTVCPDIILINEFDHDADEQAAALFQDKFLAQPQGGVGVVVTYPYRFVPPTNTGLMPEKAYDFDGDLVPGEQGDDAFGYGAYPGQYGFVVLSRYPIQHEAVRCFQTLPWKAMPGALLPVNEDKTAFYSDEELAVFRLSSKNHCDVPVEVGGEVLHVLASHPTPPAFDGPEDRNGRRNHDEVRLWRDYVSSDPNDAAYLVDDAGVAGGLGPDRPYVIVGDLNADPFDGASVDGAAAQVLAADRVNRKVLPLSLGAVEASLLQAGPNITHEGSAGLDTADFGEPPGNLRVDYVLPSTAVAGAGVFWPQSFEAQAGLVEVSDHRLVWADLDIATPAPIPVRSTAVPLDGRPETIRQQETNLGNLVVDAVLWEGRRSHMSAGAPEPVIALHNGGNIRNGTIIPVGEISDGLIAQILKFDNKVVVVEDVTGAALHELLEVAVAGLPSDFNGPFAHVAGLRFTWDPKAPPKSRITQLTVLGEPEVDVVVDGVLQPGAGPFDLATNDFVAMEGNADGWPLGSFASTVIAPSIRQSLTEYIEHFPDETVPASEYPEGMNERIVELAP